MLVAAGTATRTGLGPNEVLRFPSYPLGNPLIRSRGGTGPPATQFSIIMQRPPLERIIITQHVYTVPPCSECGAAITDAVSYNKKTCSPKCYKLRADKRRKKRKEMTNG